MSVSVVLVVLVGVLVASGTVLLLERSLTRILLGAALLGNGINLMLLAAGGRAGKAPILGNVPAKEIGDPLPQAMILTAIVISFAMTAFLLALAYRSWQLQGNDEVQDDIEDRRVASRRTSETLDSGADAEAEAEADARAAAQETETTADDLAVGRDPA